MMLMAKADSKCLEYFYRSTTVLLNLQNTISIYDRNYCRGQALNTKPAGTINHMKSSLEIQTFSSYTYPDLKNT